MTTPKSIALGAGLVVSAAFAAGSAAPGAAQVCEGQGFRLELTPTAHAPHVMSGEGFTLAAAVSQSPRRCAADLAAPFGVLDAQDTAEFVRRMETAAASADLAEPFGRIDAADLVAYNAAHAAGCD